MVDKNTASTASNTATSASNIARLAHALPLGAVLVVAVAVAALLPVLLAATGAFVSPEVDGATVGVGATAAGAAATLVVVAGVWAVCFVAPRRSSSVGTVSASS